MYVIYEKYGRMVAFFIINVVELPQVYLLPHKVPYHNFLSLLMFFVFIFLREEHQVKAKTGESKLEANCERQRAWERERE